MSRRSDGYNDLPPGTTAALGCLLALIFPLIAYLFRSRPQPYKPLSVDDPRLYGGQPEGHAEYWVWSAVSFAAGVGVIVLGLWGAVGDGLIVIFMLASGLMLGGGILASHARSFSRQSFPLPAPAAVEAVEEQAQPQAVVYTVYPPNAAPDLVTGSQLMQSLLNTAPRLTFRIVGAPDAITWQVVDMKGQYTPQVITDHIRSHYDQAVVVQEEITQDEIPQPFYRQHILFQLANEYAAPLPFFEMLKSHDPLTTITRRMDFLKITYAEQVTYSLVVLVASETAHIQAGKRLKEGYVTPLGGLLPHGNERQSGLDVRLLAIKLSMPLYHCFLVLTIEGQNRKRLTELSQMAEDVSHFLLPKYNRLVKHSALPVWKITNGQEAHQTALDELVATWVRNEDARWRDLLLVLHPAEIAALWHLPDQRFTAQHIVWAGEPVPEELTGEQGERVSLGLAISPGRRLPVYISPHDRTYHHYITGKTGMGKSTLMHNLVHQDIAAGAAVAVIDPHGKLIDDILATSIPPERVDDVVLLACGGSDYPVPLNPLRIPDGVSEVAAFNYTYWAFRRIYASVWHVGRMDRVFRNVLRTLLCDPEATPLDIARIFSDMGYRNQLLAEVKQRKLRSVSLFWQEYEGKPDSKQAEIVEPILNRTEAFLGGSLLEQMTCHPQTLNFQTFITANKIVLVSLAGDAIRSEVGSLGALFLSGFYLAAEGLGYVPDGAPPRQYLYVDELERFVTSPLPEMFSEARKLGLSLTLANQYLGQLDDDTRNGILGNVGTKLIFECGDKDAWLLSHQLAPEFDRQRLQNLGAYHMTVKTRFGGKTLPAFTVQTHPPPQIGVSVDPQHVRERSRAATRLIPATDIAAWLDQRYLVDTSHDGSTDQDSGADTIDWFDDYEPVS